MNKRGPGLVVLYRWKLHPGSEASFIDAWSRVTELLRSRAGSLGSRLHRGNDGLWYGYAQWPSEESRQRAFAQLLDPAALATMRSAIAESLPEVLLEPVSDYLVLPSALPGKQETSMSDAHENKEMLTRFLEQVWNAGDIEASDQYIAPKYTIRHDPGDPWEGQELDLAGYKERVRVSRAPFPDQCFVIQDALADANRAIITWRWSATHKGDIPGFPATGNTIKMSGATVYYIDGGRLTGHWQIADRLGIYMQLRQGMAGA